MSRRRWLLLFVPLAAASWSTRAVAQDTGDEPDPETQRIYQRISEPRGGYAKILLSTAFGRGFRFNNPYRLATPPCWSP